jgi:preprotein translocase subunit YajC
MGSLIIFVPLLVIMYFVMIRPQQKRVSEHRQVLASLEVGDEVITSAGIYGVVTEFDGPTLFLEISDGVEIKIGKDTVTSVVSYDTADDDAEADQGPIS